MLPPKFMLLLQVTPLQFYSIKPGEITVTPVNQALTLSKTLSSSSPFYLFLFFTSRRSLLTNAIATLLINVSYELNDTLTKSVLLVKHYFFFKYKKSYRIISHPIASYCNNYYLITIKRSASSMKSFGAAGASIEPNGI